MTSLPGWLLTWPMQCCLVVYPAMAGRLSWDSSRPPHSGAGLSRRLAEASAALHGMPGKPQDGARLAAGWLAAGWLAGVWHCGCVACKGAGPMCSRVPGSTDAFRCWGCVAVTVCRGHELAWSSSCCAISGCSHSAISTIDQAIPPAISMQQEPV